MSIQFQQTPFNQKVTLLNDNKYALIGDPIEGNQPGKAPKLNFEVRGNYPHIRIKLNNGQKGKDGQIDLALDLLALSSIIVAIEDAVRSREPMSQFIAVKRRGFDRSTNKPTEPYIYALIVVGRDTDGEVFFGVQIGNKNSKNHQVLKFHFTPPDYHPIVDGQSGELIDTSRLSSIMARAWAKLLENLVPLINANVWDYNTTSEGKWANERAQKEGGNNQGGYNNGGNNNYQRNNNSYNNNRGGNNYGNYDSQPKPVEQAASNAPADAGFDDDLPW